MQRWLLPTFILATLHSSAWGYIDSAASLGGIINRSTDIVVFQVEKVSRDKRVIVYKQVAALKGKGPGGQVKHQLPVGWPFTNARHGDAREILDWAEDACQSGRVAICFSNGKISQTCLGKYWYQSVAGPEEPWWTVNAMMPELNLTYYGSGERLRGATTAILAGKEVVIPTLPHGQNGAGAYFNLVFRVAPGTKDFPVQRIRASLRMPEISLYVYAEDAGTRPRAGAAKWFVGWGAGEAADVPPLIEKLKSKDARARADAAEDLGLIDAPGKAAVPALEAVLDDPDALVRVRAAVSLLRLDPGRKGGVATLLQSLKDSRLAVRVQAIQGLGEVGAADKAVVPALVEALKDEALRGATADALGAVGPGARAAVPALVQVLKDKDPALREAAAVALARIGGPGTRAAVPALIEIWEHDGNFYRFCLCLGALGPEAKEALPILLKRVEKDGLFPKGDFNAAWALWSIDPKGAVPYLGNCDFWSSSAWIWSASYFRMAGPRARDMAAALAERLSDGQTVVPPPGPGVKDMQPWAVELLRREAATTVPILIGGLQGKTAASRCLAAQTLGQIGPEARAARPSLEALLKDNDAAVRNQAAEALKKVGK
jgi:HEAT repeat protein